MRLCLSASLLLGVVVVAQQHDSAVQLWACGNAATQSWTFNATGASSRVSLDGTPFVWDLTGPSNKSGTTVHLFTQYVTNSQLWTYDRQQLRSVYAPGMCATVAASVAGFGLTIAGCSASPLQSFVYDSATHRLTLASDSTLCVDAGSNASCTEAPYSTYPYCDTSLPPSARAADLVSRLVVDEMAQLLGYQNAGVPRLGIARIHYGEALHGYLVNCLPAGSEAPGTTGCPSSFPHALVLGAAFNRSLWGLVASAISDEGRAYFNTVNRSSHLMTWAPDINPFRDPRWGRGQEVAGEDPLLVSEYIAQYARGLQEGEDPRYIKLVSTAKHFSLYDLENATDANGVYYTRMNYTAVASRRDATQFYWPPFVSAVQRGRVASIMCSYNSVCLDCDPTRINHTGVPSCADSSLQNGMLRDQWGFDGFVVSDCDAVGIIYSPHEYVPTPEGAAVAGMLGGTDVDCGATYAQHLAAAVADGNLTAAALQQAAARNLGVAFALGLFDPVGSVAYDSYGAERIDSAAHRALALEAAVQGLVLLQNNATATPWGAGQPLLPLRAAAIKRVAVIGPNGNATQTLLSNYEGGNTLVDSHSVLQALQRRGAAEGFEVAYAPGCTNASGLPSIWCQETTGFAAAVAAAAAADVVVLAVGLCSVCPDGWRVEGEGHDRAALSLPGQQDALAQAVVAAGKPVVAVLIHGGPVAIEWVSSHVPAILDAHYPGEMGGDAVAALLFGDASPSGRLTTTVYPAAFAGARPMTDMALAPHDGAPGITHLYYDGPTLYPFGWGLAYTTFAFQWFDGADSAHQTVAAAALAAGAAAPPQYVCNVTNTGAVVSDVSVLGMFSTGLPGEPLQELFDFARLAALAPGETRTATLTLPAGVAAAVDAAGEPQLVPGAYSVRVGDPTQWLRGSLRLTGGDGPVHLPLGGGGHWQRAAAWAAV